MTRRLADDGAGRDGWCGRVIRQRWQTSYLPVFAAWVTVVVLVLPPAFAFS